MTSKDRKTIKATLPAGMPDGLGGAGLVGGFLLKNSTVMFTHCQENLRLNVFIYLITFQLGPIGLRLPKKQA